MKQNVKKRLLVGIIIFLILTNLSALITFSYKKINYRKDKQEYREKWHKKRNRHMRMKEFVKNELELNEQQFETYCNLKNNNIEKTKIHISKIRKLKKDIVLEIMKEIPDKNRLNALSDSIGNEQSKLQIEMNDHFLEVKEILNKDQKTKLKELMIKMDERFRIGKKHWSKWKKENRKGQDFQFD